MKVIALLLSSLLAVGTLPASAVGALYERPGGHRPPLQLKIPSVLQRGTSPLITFRLLFTTGAAYDPPGKEGVASLTAAMLAQGGSRTMSYEQIVEAMYPMATSVDWQVDKEMTVFSGTTHIENLDRYYGLLKVMLLDPGWRTEDFARLRDDAVNFLKVSLRESNDEELGKEYLYNILYSGHPYAHHNMGRTSSLEKLTLTDVREFYRTHYTQANVVIGLAGGFAEPFLQKVQADFAKLPAGTANKKRFEAPKPASGTRIEIVERNTRSTAISFGFPISINRASKDWPALAVAVSYLGQHRSSNGQLYQRLRESRGLNYGDYTYIEYFPRGMFQFTPDPNLGRQQQIFQIWIRPVEPDTTLFTLRAALFEFDKLVREGMPREAFEATREFLGKYSSILTQTQDLRLGYALDSRYYGIPDFNTYMRSELSKLTLEDVNRAIRQYLKSDQMRMVFITGDGKALREQLIKGEPSPMKYNAPKPQAILDEDKIIQAYPIRVKPEDIVVVPAAKVFE